MTVRAGSGKIYHLDETPLCGAEAKGETWEHTTDAPAQLRACRNCLRIQDRELQEAADRKVKERYQRRT